MSTPALMLGVPTSFGASPDIEWLPWDVLPSDSPEQHENEKNNEDRADNADTPMAEAVTVASKAATEATKQHDDEQNNEDGGNRHGHAPIELSNAGQRKALVRNNFRDFAQILAK